jgi:hypothetical protein
MEKALATHNKKVTGERLRRAFCAVQKATAELAKDPLNRHAFEVYTAAWREHNVASTVEMAATIASNELYLHQVTEAGTQTENTGITGS